MKFLGILNDDVSLKTDTNSMVEVVPRVVLFLIVEIHVLH